MLSKVLLFSLLGLAAANSSPAILDDRATGILTFKCGNMKDVCENMCCAASGPRAIGLGLTYDAIKTDTQVKRNRRKQAGCIATGGNHCSVKKSKVSGMSCDEYPFASTSPQNGVKTRISRCVKATSNSAQGGQIAGYIKSIAKGTKFTVAFDSSYTCNAKTACAAAGADTQGTSAAATTADVACDGTDGDDEDDTSSASPASCAAKRALAWEESASMESKRYLLNTGEVINVPGGATIGQNVSTVVPRNETLWEEQTSDFGFPLDSRDFGEDDDGEDDDGEDDDGEDDYEWMVPNLQVVRSYIVSELSE